MRCSADFKNNNIKMSGSTRSTNHDMEALWFSLLPKNASFDRNVEEEILKLTLLLQSTQLLVTGLHQKQKSALSQLKAVQDQLRVATDLRDKSESDQDVLRKELQALKIEFHSVQEEARKQQKKAEDAVAKNERLKKKISAEVEVRLHKMFNDCLQQNKAATVLDMMTQMCQENVIPDGDFSVEETVPKRSERVAFLKSSALNKFTEIGSPDVIPPTPPISVKSNQSCSQSKKPKPSLKPSSKHKVVESAPSSPDVIGDTPPFKNIERKDNRKKNEKCIRLFKREEDDIENKPIVYVKDTQDVDDETCLEKRPALKENITVPETLDPDNYGKKSTKVKSENTTHSNKENEKISPNQSDEKSVKIADLSTDAEFPSTPKKASLHNNSKSPILGKSGHKSKKSIRQSSGLAEMSLKKSPRRNKDLKTKSRTSLNMTLLSHNKSKNSSQGANNLLMNDDSNTSYEIRTNKKIIKSKQPTIFDAFSKESQNKSKLSLSKRKKDISSRPEFNGGQRSAAEHSVDLSHLSENEQVKIAIENSMREKPLEDTDATLFIPECSQLHSKFENSHKEIPNTTKSTSEIKPVETNPPDEKEVFFEPLFASTALEGFTQMKPKSAFSLQEAADIGKPLHSSTEKVCDENSALNELHKYLEENNEDEEVDEDEDMENEKLEEGKTTGFAPETSYDRLPPKSNSPNYAYKGPVVRKKNERKNLKGFDCSRCAEYYEAAFAGDNERAKKIILDGCSRHRDRAKNGPRSRTPPGYWDLEFPPTQVVRKLQQQETPSPS